MGRQEARFQPGDHACLVTWKSSFFPLYQLHSEILEKLEQAIVFRKGSPICMEEFRDLRVFIHVNSDDYLERHYTEETADWCNHETRTSSVQQWIEHRPWVQLVPGPTKNLICAINEYKWKHYQLRCVVYDIQRAPYGGNYGPLSHASWEKRFLIWGWQDELDRVPDLVEWSQDYSSILCLPISDPVPKPRVMLKALHRRDVDMIRRFMPLSLFPGNAIWHPDDIEQITAAKHESDAEGEDADMQAEDPEFLLVDTADQVPGTECDQIGRVQVGPIINNSPWHQDQRAKQRAAASCGNAAAGTSKPVTVFSSE
ncbi:unnamed protein product [Effrenium voratum]|uniref:Uncharacterized protein n=1 Tax=Effrenium voratum TaxID=2562239 RepID=A0AA36IE58_9DINO|nr:unnamed protein product [Effrenium voratum]